MLSIRFSLCLVASLSLLSSAPSWSQQTLPRFPDTTPSAIWGATSSTRTPTSASSKAKSLDALAVSLAADFTSNASAREREVVVAQIGRLAKLLAARDAQALEIFKLDITPPTSALRATASLSRLQTSLRGALVRVQFSFHTIAGTSATRVKTPSRRFDFAYDVWLARVSGDSFALGAAWLLPSDAAMQLRDDALRLWNQSLADNRARVAPSAPRPNNSGGRSTTVSALMAPKIAVNRGGDIATLVAEYRGGRWVALRATAPWQGAVLDAPNLEAAAKRMRTAAQKIAAQEQTASSADTSSTREAVKTSSGDAANEVEMLISPSVTPSSTGVSATNSNEWIGAWLVSQMNRYRRRAAGTAHFVLQRGARGWIGVDSVFEPAREATDASYARADENARASRLAQNDDFGSPIAHFNYALALSRVNLFNEAADELAKATLMQPDLADEAQRIAFETARRDDAQNRVDAQRDIVTRLGQNAYSAEHPLKVVPRLQDRFRIQPTPLLALQISLEYSRLAFESEAKAWYNFAMNNAANFIPTANSTERAWFNVLRDQTKTRFDLAPGKPANVIRSDLFTVRCTLNDRNIVQLLSGLESAQYTIYSRFFVPMGNTEVILWGNQALFQNYTTQQAGRNTSEFVTALTLTQLVNAENGPVVLGEEINFFADPRADSISTIAHEYGHIAVRNLARGREVPDWFNEGIATYVEGGYENYLSRVRNARQRNGLLSMRELQIWNVDGERAFLAYSQANSMIDFIVESKNPSWGGQAVLAILKKIGEDVPPDEAFKSVLRVTPQQFYNLWVANGIKAKTVKK